MKIVSRFVREQQRYSKNQLRDKFLLDDAEIEKFIKNLKSYGILKTVANSMEQKELSDLMDGDIQAASETAGNNECLYVFTYVGIVTVGSRIIKSYPKYILSDSEPFTQMKQVIKVLEKYSHSEEQIINLFNGNDDNRSFNVLAVILYLLNDYFENGVYNNTEEDLEMNGEGVIMWNRVIEDGFAIIEDGCPYYTDMITRRTIENERDYFKLLHEYILTDCSMQLHEAGLEDLLEMETVTLSEAVLEDFGERKYILDRIMQELNVQYSTHRQILLKTIYTYISQNKKILEEDQGISMFGTMAFHAVWEKACADVFGNKLHMNIGQIQMSVPLADGYDRKKKLIDLIDKPKWHGIDTTQEARETLVPDLVSINKYDGQDWFVIFDAKYYLLQLEKGHKLRGNPGIGDITKQYLYQLAFKKFIADHQITIVKNCFLLPTEKKEIVSKGVVKLDMLSSLGLEDIQIREIPTDMLFNYYLNRKRIDIRALQL